jgi:ATP-dependent exoDNAse (exonuclease V) beta subunit
LLFEQNGFIGSSADGNGLPNFTKLFLDEKKRQVREEEQRLFYVAVTRAKQWLILCGAGHEPAIKKEEINLESWYLQSKKAIIKLSGKEKNCKYLKGRRTLVLEHHWGRTPKKTGLPSRINFTKG